MHSHDPKNTAASAPQPEPLPKNGETPPPAGEAQRLDPTRYGDWELGGKCVDF